MVCNDPRTALLQRVRELLDEIDDDALATAARFLEEIAKSNPTTTAQIRSIKKVDD